MASVIFGGRECQDPNALRVACLQHSWPVSPWEGRANLYVCPTGREPGTGAVLLRKSDLDAINLAADHSVRFLDDNDDRTLKTMTVRDAVCVVPSNVTDGEEVFLVRFADRRHNLARGPGINRTFNHVREAGDTPEYESATTNGGTAYTWQEVVSALWSAAGVPGSSTLPFTPHGTPHQLVCVGTTAYAALNDVLDRLAVALDYNPLTDTFSLVRIGSDPSDEVQALSKLGTYMLHWDGQPLDPARASAPATVRVLFRVSPRPTDGGSPFYALDVSSGISGAASGSVVTLFDDMVVLASPAAGLLGQMNARAAERKDDYARKFNKRDRRLLKTFRDLNGEVFTAVGASATVAVYEDRGQGLRAELHSGPDNALERLRYPLADINPEQDAGGGGDCSPDFSWIQDVAGLKGATPTPETAKTFDVIVSKVRGRCDCIPFPQGSSIAQRYFTALDADGDTDAAEEAQPGDVPNKMVWTGTGNNWEGWGTFAGCCSTCFRASLELDPDQTVLANVPIFNLTISGTGCDSGAPTTQRMKALCGNERWMELSTVNSRICAVPGEAECVSGLWLRILCRPCDLVSVGCEACRERIAPPIYKAVRSGVTKYLSADGACLCAYTDGCEGDTLSISGSKAIYTADDGNVYEFDTNTATPGCNKRPNCWQEMTLVWVSGPAGSGSVVITPKSCEPTPPTSNPPCIDGAPNLLVGVTVLGCAEQVKTAPYADTGYTAASFVWGGCLGCMPVDEGYQIDIACVVDGCGNYSIAVSGGAPTGSLSSFVVTTHSTRPLYATFTAVIECSTTGEGAPFVTRTLTGWVSEIGADPPYWCLGGVCVGPFRESPGEGAIPYRTQAQCQAACGCVGGLSVPMVAARAVAQPVARPGTELKKILKGLGISSEGCGCDDRAARMDGGGVEWCKRNREEIAGWLRDQANRRGWRVLLSAAAGAMLSGLAFRLNPLDPFGSIVDEAIRRAETKAAGNRGGSSEGRSDRRTK